jgi:hypothetical protein
LARLFLARPGILGRTSAKGAKNHWMRLLAGDDTSFFTLYNAIGMTKELNGRFSINAVISNLFSKSESGAIGKYDTDSFEVSGKLITKAAENAEFNVGISVDVTKTVSNGAYFGDADDTVTTFSIPVGIKVNF